MTNALVILDNNPAMNLCSVCPKPGKCCSGFTLTNSTHNGSFWEDEWPSAGERLLKENDLPYVPMELDSIAVSDDDGRRFGRGLFKCEKLLPTGRCGIYDERPITCRIFIPGSNQLCVFGTK